MPMSCLPDEIYKYMEYETNMYQKNDDSSTNVTMDTGQSGNSFSLPGNDTDNSSNFMREESKMNAFMNASTVGSHSQANFDNNLR